MKNFWIITFMMLAEISFSQSIYTILGVDRTEEKTSHPIKIIKNKPVYKSMDTVKLSSAKTIIYVGVETKIRQKLPFKAKHKISYQTDVDATITTLNNNEFKVYMGRRHTKILTVYVIDGDVLKGKLYYKVEYLQ